MRIAAIALLGLSAVACQSEGKAPVDSTDFVQWQLPTRLREISGLALTRDDRLLAITDEEAVVYEIDFRNGSLVKAFAAGNRTIRGDFEGIAVLGDRVWLLASDGTLYSFKEGVNGERVAHERTKTGLSDQCEFEGLAADPATGRLLLVCKESHNKKKGLRIFEWPTTGDGTDGDRQQRAVEIHLDEKAMSDSIREKQVNPSGIAIDPVTGNRIVVAARQLAVFELTRDGMLIDVIMRLDAKRHHQPEGITITSDGHLLIADEAGAGPARLAIYAPKQQENRE